ncbi:carboxypeptidase regulatory-like domain-containing protein [Acinetobacter johnsonii]|uniref:Carboxypeptidase regulatory-like domain-containing protein n=1 Tax=Acinetobacter johnsonii TaxID=40214 RepID=A0A3R9F3B3_ACIJO|nr:carboxypeptidase regulatory-like domain-containing protein [Acinetobacter johnsonii]RSE25148.1 carboxypeptidase regulatory-like domain-containing protein [Acinetobacter johnsonii]
MLLIPRIINAVYSNNDVIRTSDKGLSIKGTVKQKNIPIPCRVRLFEKLSGRLIADVLTDNTGYYAFDHLTQAKFFLVAHHPQNQFNAVIQDNVVPK